MIGIRILCRNGLVCLLLLLWNAAALGETTPLTREDFLQLAKAVFVGRVVEVESFADRPGEIFTRYVFEVEEALKGVSGRSFILTEPGGRVGDLILSVSESPAYFRGHEYVVFSYLDRAGRNRSLGGVAGQIPVVRLLGDLRSVRVYPSHPLSSKGARPGVFQDLSEFSEQLRSALGGGRDE